MSREVVANPDGVTPAYDFEEVSGGPSLRRLALTGLAVVVLGIGGLLGWAALAMLDSAVPAAGQLVVQSKRKTVSLLDSGILRDLRVAEGQHVAAGDVLMVLDDGQPRAAVTQASARLVAATARVVRLRAEMEDREAPVFPDSFGADVDSSIAAPLLAAEATLFEARREAYKGAVAVQERRIAQLEQQIAAHEAQAVAYRTRLDLVQQELRGVNQLLARGFATRTRALEMQRMVAELEGEVGELDARSAEARQAIAQAELEILNLRTTRRNEAAREMQDAVVQVAEGRAQLASAQDLLRRSVIVSPDAGTVTDIRFFTPGSSIVAGQPVMDIVPIDDSLLIEAAVAPADIERVSPGQRVNVRLTGFSHRRVAPLTGRLIYAGADRQVNARGEPFFLVRAMLDPGAQQRLPEGVSLAPGMPADVLIVGSARTALDYLLSPILDGMRRAMREE